MRQSVRRWLYGIGTAAAVGVSAIGQGGIAAASPVVPPGSTAGVSAAAAARPASAPAAAYIPPRKALWVGMHGEAVRRVQRRLAVLKYYPGKIDGEFGQDTIEAVWAFERVQGYTITAANSNEISRRMERALVHPRRPKVFDPRGGSNLRIEVNQTTEVLVLYHHNKIELISHVSTGGRYYYPCPPPGSGTCGPAITPDGAFRAHWFAPGWLTVPLGTMYNPVFFIGGAYAIHGDIPVPWYAASHGCVRIPMDIAQFFHKLIHISQTHGTPIYIHGRAKEVI
jgi:L,D-transpeptidase catalytic domain/Putative peptidoglycan binding domain